jgi:hypothetical protein
MPVRLTFGTASCRANAAQLPIYLNAGQLMGGEHADVVYNADLNTRLERVMREKFVQQGISLNSRRMRDDKENSGSHHRHSHADAGRQG